MNERLKDLICPQLTQKGMLRGSKYFFFLMMRPPWPVPFSDIGINNKELFSLKPQILTHLC